MQAVDMHDGTAALQTALILENGPLSRVLTQGLRCALGAHPGCRACGPASGSFANLSLILRQIDRAVAAGAYGETKPLLTAWQRGLSRL